MPELSVSEVDTSVQFLGHRLPFPLFISCMTGGSQGGFAANRRLAQAAQQLGIPVGLGSIRVALHDASLAEHFRIKHIAPDVPVLANIGAVQVRDVEHARLLDLLGRLEVQALVVHLNPGQELFQEDGDRDFRGLADALRRLCARSPLPVIVKETGFSIRPSLARELREAGAAYVDVAGSGGTNWISVESYRLPTERRAQAKEFRDWGMPTAVLLLAARDLRGALLASGGIRSGMDAAKALALGAELAGLALPVIRAVTDGGTDAVVRLFLDLQATLQTVMVLTGSRNLDELRRGVVWVEPQLASAAETLRRADEIMDTDRRGPRSAASAGRAIA